MPVQPILLSAASSILPPFPHSCLLATQYDAIKLAIADICKIRTAKDRKLHTVKDRAIMSATDYSSSEGVKYSLDLFVSDASAGDTHMSSIDPSESSVTAEQTVHMIDAATGLASGKEEVVNNATAANSSLSCFSSSSSSSSSNSNNSNLDITDEKCDYYVTHASEFPSNSLSSFPPIKDPNTYQKLNAKGKPTNKYVNSEVDPSDIKVIAEDHNNFIDPTVLATIEPFNACRLTNGQLVQCRWRDDGNCFVSIFVYCFIIIYLFFTCFCYSFLQVVITESFLCILTNSML